MPIPKSKSVGKVLSFLKKDKPGMKKKQKLAIALETARKAGAAIKPKKKAVNKRKKKTSK